MNYIQAQLVCPNLKGNKTNEDIFPHNIRTSPYFSTIEQLYNGIDMQGNAVMCSRYCMEGFSIEEIKVIRVKKTLEELNNEENI